MNDFFLIEEPAPVLMSKDDFVKKTKAVLNKIMNEYHQAWMSRRLRESEYPHEDICCECKGCGTFKDEHGQEKECVQDKVEGDCFTRFFDSEQFSESIEPSFEQIHELLSVDAVTA